MKTRESFENGTREGFWEFYDNTGKLRAKDEYHHDVAIGAWENFDEAGNPASDESASEQ